MTNFFVDLWAPWRATPTRARDEVQMERDMERLSLTGADSAGEPSVDDAAAAILEFWFPNRAQTLEAAYKKKWFVTEEGVATVDEQIKERFGALLAQIESMMSDSTPDQQTVLDVYEVWLRTPTSTVALVVLLDQFSRHIYRKDAERDAKVQANDLLATMIAENFLDEKSDQLCELTTAQQVFLLLPFRHTQKTCERLQRCLDIIDERAILEVENRALLDKFRKTTLRCYQDLVGKQHKHGDNILEREEFTPSEDVMAVMGSHALYKTIGAFMRERMAKFGNTIAVSLSGGVDSMVLAYILKHQGYNVVTLHIDYKNRPESTEEADFVDDWSKRHGMVFERCTVNQIRRGVTPREQYEIESRKIRYGFYKDAGVKYGFPAVLLGHHHGDVQENIITNLMRGANLLSVNGMSEEGVVEGVRIWRPMLPHMKDDVLTFAHAYGVPYFLDSTPTWSTRGKLRNQLIPLLEDMFGDGFMRNVSMIGDNSDQLSEMVEEAVFQPFWDATKVSDVGCYIDCAQFISLPTFFWKQVIRETCHGLGASMMKDRSVRQFLGRIKRTKSSKDGWMSLKKENATFVQGDTFAMFASEFMPRVKDICPGAKITMECDEESLELGNWSLSLQVVANTCDESGVLPLDAPPVNIWNVLENEITYHIPHEGIPATYVIDPEVRFPPVRNLDVAVRDALPLVVPPEFSFAHLPEESRPPRKMLKWSKKTLEYTQCVRVQLKFRRTKLYTVDSEEEKV